MKDHGVLEYWSRGGMSTEKAQSQAQTESPLPLSALCPNRKYLAEICIEREDGCFMDYKKVSLLSRIVATRKANLDAFSCYSAVKVCLMNCLLLVAKCIPIQYLRSYNDFNPVGGPDQRCQEGVTAWVGNSLEFRLRLQPSRVS